MNENNIVIKYLNSRGYEVSTKYYNKIESWKNWYKNYVRKFHEYYDANGDKKELFKLGMAKKVPEDWASILYTERDEIICDKEANQEYLDKEFQTLKFDKMLSGNIEKAFYSGTCGTVAKVKNVKVENGEITADENSKYSIVNVTADKIIPLTIEDGIITEVAIVSITTKNNEKVYYIEMHTLVEDGYKIENIYLQENGSVLEDNDNISEYYTHSYVPLFNLLMPNIENNDEDNNGLGLSIYANAIDQLKGTDIAYNNYVMDTVLGGKKVFYNKSLVKYQTVTYKDENGEFATREIPIYPDDITKQQFQILGDEFSNSSDETLIHEYNPDLRIEDNEKNVNMALNVLSFKCGMGKSYYKFEQGTVVTATQYLGENKDLVNNAKKHRANLNNYVVGISRSILLIGRLLFGNKELDENDRIELSDKDGFLVSDEELRQQWRDDFNAGLMSKKEYIMKVRNVNEEEALRIIEEINNDNPTTSQMFGE